MQKWSLNMYGLDHDATVLRSSDLFQNHDKIPNSYCLLGDSAFPILELITSLRDCGNLTQEQRRINRVHSRCRQVIKRAFGMLKCRFRRLLRFDSCDMNILVGSVLSACVLHNFTGTCLSACALLVPNMEILSF